ncbi:MAG TPA: SpoIID/LytB domain-containing protein [Candidatus Limnocylindria bacterium]|nr:SpoIID/LytB domain-containing protein [Candidatus Limnocylindria bacterium]
MPLNRLATLPLALILFSLLVSGSGLAAPVALLRAAYTVPAPPAAVGVASTTAISVQLTNTGDEAWNASGANPVNLTYHWYDAAGTTAVIWDGVRTPLGADVAPQGQRTVSATVVAPAAAGTYLLRFALVKEGVRWFDPSAAFSVAVQAATYTATYQVATPPTAVPAGGTAQVAVALTNTGNQTWNATGANPVNLTYHWYDAAGTAAVVWDGVRTPLGADVAPRGQRTVTANVVAPSAPGTYVLRLALVKEGVAWFPPGPAMTVNALSAYVAQFTAPTLPAFIAGGTYTVPVTVKNAGAAAWNASGANLIDLSYHWHDSAGRTVVWDGVRTLLPADVAPGASATVNARITAPLAAGAYTLTIDMVREGVGWFGLLGSTPYRVAAPVEAIRFAASYAIPASITAYWAESKTVSVTVTNTGNQTWSGTGANPVNLAFHILDASGRAVVWDGTRTPIGADIAPGQQRTLAVAFTAPTSSGTYTLVIDLVREGIGWFADGGSPPARITFSVTSGLNGGYGASTTPAQVTIGAVIDLSVTVVNYGPRTWPAGGPNPVRLSYHISGANTGTMYVWDGARGFLPTDVPPSSQVTVPIRVTVPSAVGDYIIAWDLVQEGVAWFSSVNVQTKREPFAVVSGVVFYGSGFGHGVGMSQYGAQGYATGAAGPALTGEQIIQKYFPGTAFQFVDAARPFNRVLLSQPSSASRYVCGTNRYFSGSFGDVVSAGGFRVLDETASDAVIGQAAGNVPWQFVARNGQLEAWDKATGTPRLVRSIATTGDRGFAVVPLDPNQPLRFVQKDQTDGRPGLYRGNFRFTNLGNTLRVINAVSYDDYVRGVISFEMPRTWHAEALKAQAYAARSYGYASFKGGARDYDVSDDQSDQCYGGVSAEYPTTDAAVRATAGRLVTYNGAIVKTYFASSNGGHTLEFGCWGNRVVRSGSTWVCTPDPTQPYLAAIPDPADRAVQSPPNPRASWSATFTGAEIASAVLCAGGPNIGTLQGIDVSNQSPRGVGHVISVRVIGSAATADVRADTLLRSCLGLRSTMVRLSPF